MSEHNAMVRIYDPHAAAEITPVIRRELRKHARTVAHRHRKVRN